MSFNNTLLISKRLTAISSHARAHPSTPKSNNQNKLTKTFVKQMRALPVQRVHAENQQHSIQQTQPISSIRQHKHTSPTATEAAPLPKPTTLTGVNRISCGVVANLQIISSSAHINFQTACPLNPQTRQP